MLPIFECLSSMLSQALIQVTEAMSAAVIIPHSAQAHLETLILATFNLVAMSDSGFRRYMVSRPGFVGCMLRLSVLLADERQQYISVGMRTAETVRVISKDNEDLLVQYTEMIAKAAMQPHIHPKVVDDLMCVL